jgi:hypothetical protein
MIWRIAVVILIAGTAAFAPVRADWRDGLDIDNADLRLFRMILVSEGVEAGAMEYGWTRIGDRYLVEDRTHMAPNVLETASALIDGRTFLPHNVAVKFSMGDSLMNVDLRWADGMRQGQITSRRTGGEETVRDVRLVEDVDAPLRMAAFGLVAALPLKDNYQTSFNWFNTMANRTERVDVVTRGRARVKVPAGIYEAYRVELRGVTPENILYISTARPRQIIRIDVVGRDMYFLRVEG